MFRLPLAVALCALACACQCQSRVNGLESQLSADPVALDFGDVAAGQSKALSLQLTNAGKAAVAVSAVSVTHDARSAFSVDSTPATVPPGASATLTVTYHAP